MNEEIKKLQNQIDELKKKLEAFNSASSIPLEVAEAFRNRLKIVSGDVSAADITSYTQAVSEGGAGSYNVPLMVTALKKIVVGGNTYLIGVYEI